MKIFFFLLLAALVGVVKDPQVPLESLGFLENPAFGDVLPVGSCGHDRAGNGSMGAVHVPSMHTYREWDIGDWGGATCPPRAYITLAPCVPLHLHPQHPQHRVAHVAFTPACAGQPQQSLSLSLPMIHAYACAPPSRFPTGSCSACGFGTGCMHVWCAHAGRTNNACITQVPGSFHRLSGCTACTHAAPNLHTCMPHPAACRMSPQTAQTYGPDAVRRPHGEAIAKFFVIVSAVSGVRDGVWGDHTCHCGYTACMHAAACHARHAGTILHNTLGAAVAPVTHHAAHTAFNSQCHAVHAVHAAHLHCHTCMQTYGRTHDMQLPSSFCKLSGSITCIASQHACTLQLPGSFHKLPGHVTHVRSACAHSAARHAAHIGHAVTTAHSTLGAILAPAAQHVIHAAAFHAVNAVRCITALRSCTPHDVASNISAGGAVAAGCCTGYASQIFGCTRCHMPGGIAVHCADFADFLQHMLPHGMWQPHRSCSCTLHSCTAGPWRPLQAAWVHITHHRRTHVTPLSPDLRVGRRQAPGRRSYREIFRDCFRCFGCP